MVNPVHVVGYGMIDALGNNPSDCFPRFLDDVDYSVDFHPMIERDEKITKGLMVDYETLQLPDLDPKLMRTYTRSQLLAFHVVDQAFKMSGLKTHQEVAVIFSSASNSYEAGNKIVHDLYDGKRVNLRKLVNILPDMIPSHLCGHYGFMGASVSMLASCATSMFTMEYAQRLCDEYEYVVVGSSDYNVNVELMLYFQALGALGNYNCPFDDKRTGFMMGDGAGCLILQSSQKVKEYGSTIHATLYPSGMASDALDMTAPAMDARGAKIAITKALKNADMHSPMPMVIDAVSGHATSTFVGDPIEYMAITDILDKTPIYAPKSKIGHTIGAASVLETIYAIESMKNRVIPHIHNLNKCSLDRKECLVRENLELPNKTLRTLNNSFAFGGKCISQVIEV